MDMEIKKKEKGPIKVLFYSWVNIPHSYALVNCFQLINLYKNYGPDGLIKNNAIDIYIEEAPYYNPEWNKKKKLVYSDEYNNILKNLKIWNKTDIIDLIYSITYPYNINLTNETKDIPKIVFYTSEFQFLTHQYFSLQKPDNINENYYDEYIKLFLNQFSNIYFTAPSIWSKNGLNRYLSDSNRNRLITHGVDTSLFYKHNNDTIRNEIRNKYNIKENDIVMINIGAMTTNKGILLILEALHVLVNKMDKIEYKLILKGSEDLYTCTQFLEIYFNQFKEHAKMTKLEIDNLLENHIIFINKTLSYKLINDLFNACDIYLSPYLAEGFGLTMLESLAAGLPILVPITGSTQEYIESIYKNGGDNYITYVSSEVQQNSNGLYQNMIKVEDVINTLLNTDFKKEKKNYQQMINYINKELSWNYVSTLLYDYFIDILA